MPAEIRLDPLTGRRAALSGTPGKPLPLIDRDVRDPGAGACPFCVLAAGDVQAGDVVREADGSLRRVLAASDAAVVVENLWSIFGSRVPEPVPGSGASEVVIARGHRVCLEDLPDDRVAALGAMLVDRRDALAARFPVVEMLVNVGANAGGSIAHLHGQVLAAHVPDAPSCPPEGTGTCAVCADVGTATSMGLGLPSRGDLRGYVPAAPSNNLELRVAGACGVPLARQGPELLLQVAAYLRALAARGHAWPYNVLLHGGRHPHAHVLLRCDPGVVYQRAFNLVPVNADLHALAQTVTDGLP